MPEKFYFHLFANGADAQNFIIDLIDYYAAFNLIGVCAANTDVKVLSFAIEDTHPHMLLYGTESECALFMEMYKASIMHHIIQSRGDHDDVRLSFEMLKVDGDDYLRTVAVYTIIQPTKDGKPYMPYNYPWGTGSMYFNSNGTIPIWLTWPDGKYTPPFPIGQIPVRNRGTILFSRKSVPEDWLVCNGLILPSNYVDVKMFEDIFVTANCFRVFLGGSRKKEEVLINRMSKAVGIQLSDFEADKICSKECLARYGKRTARWLSPEQRLSLACRIRRTQHLSIRQIAKFCRVPEQEIRKYVR